MLIGILGPLTIDGDDGPVAVGGSKRRLLLTLLAISHPRPVSVARITDVLWGENAPPSAAATVQSYVYQLRRLLGSQTVVTMPEGYALAGCDVDAGRFEATIRHDGRETVEARRHRLDDALRLWRGEPFVEFPDVAELAAERTRLVELQLAATADRLDDELALGRHAAVVAELEALVAAHPLRERFWAQLMIALYRSDRQADALRAYVRLRHHLRDEVGVSPGQALATLEQQILSHDPALRGARRPSVAEHPPTERRRAAILDIAGDGAANPRRLRFDSVTDAIDAARHEAQWDPGASMAIHLGEVDDHAGELSGSAVDRVARLSAVAQRGQILLTAAARADIAPGHAGEIQIADLGERVLRSFGQPERVFQLLAPGLPSELAPLADRAPDELEIFVGRTGEVEHVLGRVRRLRNGASGGVVMLVGEAGIGKTATADQIARAAAADGVVVLWGRSIDGPWLRPYGAVMDAIADYLRRSDEDDPPLVPRATVDEIRSLLPSAGRTFADNLSVGDQEFEASERQLRALVTISRFVTELSASSPVLLVLDDLHWADAGTLAAVRHLARDTVRLPVLVLGTFRDDEVGADHPLRAVLGTLPRENNVERVRLHGLTTGDVAAIAQAITGAEVAPEDAARIAADTAGNPFFVHQVIRQPGGGLPGSVVDVVADRLRRLPSSTQQLLRAACVFDGDFPFAVATAVAGLVEGDALDSLDGALDAHLLVAGDRPDTYGFVHALAREAIAAELNPSRRIRLHRRAAEALLASAGSGDLAADLASAIAGHFHRSRSLPGSEQGVPAALVAAEHATAVGALDEAVDLCRAALDLVPPDDAGQPELLGRLGLALARAARADEATVTIEAAIDAIASAHGPDRAADYVVEAWLAGAAGLEGLEPRLLERGLELAGDRRDPTWAYLYVLCADHRDDSERLVQGELFALASRLIMAHTGNPGITIVLSSTHPTRDLLLTLREWPSARLIGAGDLLTTVDQFHETAIELKRVGRLLSWAKHLAYESMAEAARGNLGRAGQILDEVARADLPFTASSQVRARLLLAAYLLWCAEDDGWELVNRFRDEFAAGGESADGGIFVCARAKAHARRGRTEAAAVDLDLAMPQLPTYPFAAHFEDRLVVHDFVEALWLTGLDRHVERAGRLVDERLARDLRGPMSDMRLCKARLAALGGDRAEARRWFAESRLVLDEAGARPLRAIVDFDEGLMHHRLGAHGDSRLRAQLLDDAIRQFAELGMTGWLRRAHTLVAAAHDE